MLGGGQQRHNIIRPSRSATFSFSSRRSFSSSATSSCNVAQRSSRAIPVHHLTELDIAKVGISPEVPVVTARNAALGRTP